MSGRRAALAAGALLAVLAARAEDKPAPTNAGEATISSAKKDFDAIKASRDGALQQKAELPRLGGVPDLPAGNENLPRPWASKKDELLEKQKKSQNWLLDAMQKDKKSGATTAKDRDDELPTDDDKAASRETNEADRERDAKSTPVVNPLARYMSGWLTPQDFAMLQASGSLALKDGGAANSGSTASVNLPGAATPSGGNFDASLAGIGLGNPANQPNLSAPQENPFLASLVSGGSTPAFTPPATMPPPAPPASTSAIFQAPAPEPASARSNIPDFAKPSEDAKAFKPMKRF